MIIVSAILYLIPFLSSYYTYPCLFIWMIPLLTYDRQNSYGFSHGYLWGCIFYAGHLAWLARIMPIAYIFITIYLSLFSGLWLWSKQQLIDRYVINHNHNQQDKNVAWCLTWIISTVSFIYLTTSCSFAIFDCFEGYFLSNPLLPLTFLPCFIKPIAYIPQFIYWAVIISINLIFYSLLNKYDSNALIFIVLLFLFPLLVSRYEDCSYIDKDDFLYIQPYWNEQNLTASQKFYAISRELDQIACMCPSIKYILMPESSFSHDLIVWSDKLDAWTSLFSKRTCILIGAHRKDKDHSKIYNTLFYIQDGRIVDWYDKQHLVFFTERQPRIFKAIFGSRILDLFSYHEFSYPDNDQADNKIIAGFQPAICSELLCNMKKFRANAPVLFICNDSLLHYSYAIRLAKCAAQLVAMQHKVQIFYVGSFDYCIFAAH